MDLAPTGSPVVDDLCASARALLRAGDEAGLWRLVVEGPWALATPDGVHLPTQGWKLHISATPSSATDVLDAVVPVLAAEAVPFKFAATAGVVRMLNATHAERSSGGKFLTIYPADDAAAVRVADACHRATAGLAGPAILSDRPYRPGSLVHYRYGGFSATPTIDADGVVVHLISGPDGPVADERGASYRAPSWLADPFQGTTPPTAPRSPGEVLLNGRYRVEGALAHSNKGGTYLAADTATGRLVVVKEGRPHVGAGALGDARDRIRHEARMLALVGPLRRAPALVEVFEQSGHVFLVEDHVDAPSLRDVVEGDLDGPVRTLPAEEALALAQTLAGALAAFHAAGVVVGDFNPNNILLPADGSVVLVDLEHARPVGPSGGGVAAGTPGYASPEQLAGRPSGLADDCWSLGATIAFLATGADPFFPSGADDTWSDPGRLAAWLGAQVAAGDLDARLCDVALRAMAPRPTDRLSPDAVLSTLRGEGCRTAPGRGGPSGPAQGTPEHDTPRHDTPEHDTAEHGALGHSTTEHRAAEALGDIVGWLTDTMGTGPAGHLWPAGAAAATLDPIAVQAGAAGVGLFLARVLAATHDLPGAALARFEPARVEAALAATAAWTVEHLARAPRPPGLYFGTSGVAWFLSEAAAVLGRDDLGRRANELALRLPVHLPNSDITHGTAGLGLAALAQWQASGDDRFLARAVVSGEQVLRAAVRTRDGALGGGPGVTWPVPASAPTRLAGTVSYGYAHGNAGIATFLYALSAATGDPAFAAVATEALLTVLPLAVVADGAAYWPASPESAADSSESGWWPSWCNGSSGIGTAFLRGHLATGEATFLTAAAAAAQAGLRERWRSGSGQCHGLAGDAELLLDLVDHLTNRSDVSRSERADQGLRPDQRDLRNGQLAALAPDSGDRYRAAALVCADALLLQRRRAPGSGLTVFADDSGATLGAGFGTGLAGTGAFLLRLVAGGPRLLMLDDLLTGPDGSGR